MSRQNPQCLTEPSIYNPAGRTRGFNFKITSQPKISCGTTSFSLQSKPMASFTASIIGPSHHQGFAGTTSATATYLRAVPSSAYSNAGTHGLAAKVSAASGLHALGTLLRTPVTQRETREAPGDFDSQCNPDSSAPAHQMRHSSPRHHSHNSSDLILDRTLRPRERDFTAVSD